MKPISMFIAATGLALLPACSAFAPLTMADIDDKNRRCQGKGLGFKTVEDAQSYIAEMERRGFLNSVDIDAINRQVEHNSDKGYWTAGVFVGPGMSKCGVIWNVGHSWGHPSVDRYTSSSGTHETWWYSNSGSMKAVRFGPDGIVRSISS